MVAITVHDFALFVPVAIGSQRGLACLDTGATHTSVDTALATPRRSGRVRGAHGDRTVGQGRIARLAFDDEVRADLDVWIDDLGAHFSHVPFPVLAILGCDVLQRPLVLDLLRLRAGLGGLGPGPELSTIRASLGRSISVLIDTGAGISIVHARRMASAFEAARPLYTDQITDASGQAVPVEVRRSRVPLSLGDPPHELGPIDLAALDLERVERQLGPVDLILGASALLASRCTWVLSDTVRLEHP